MPPSSLGFTMLDNAVAGYRLAWAHRRRLLPVLLPVLAVMVILPLVLDLLMGRDHLVIVNGGLVVAGEVGMLSWLKLGLDVASWLIAVTAAALSVVGALRGRPVDPLKAVAVACRRFPGTLLRLCAAAAGACGVIWVAGVAGTFGGRLGVVLVAGVLTGLAVVAARLLFGLVTGVFGGSGWELTRGRVLRTAGAFLLGGVAFPMFVAYLVDGLRSAVNQPVLTDLLDAILLVGLVAVQAVILAHAFLQQRDEADANPLGQADVDAVDARLDALAGTRPSWTWWGAAAMVVPVLLSAGVALTNPYAAPSLRSSNDAPGSAVAAAWPAGRHPVIVTNFGIRFCDDDLCDRYVGRDVNPPVMDGWSTAAIGPDGTVVTAAVTGARENGGPFIEYGRCTRAGCQHEWIPVRASAREPFGWPAVAASSAPDGAVWFAVAMTPDEDEPGGKTTTISLIRCAHFPCAKPERHVVGRFDRAANDGWSDGRRGRLSIGADGRPVAAFATGMSFHVLTCEPVTCANPRTADTDAGPSDAVSTTPTGLDDDVASLKHGALRIGDHQVTLTTEAADESGALAVAGSRVYATTAVATTAVDSGLHVTVGTRPTSWQQVLWRCERSRCDRPERVPLDVFSGPAGRTVLAVGADGRVLIIRDDRVLLLTNPATGMNSTG